jgi:hypothetical protein
MSGIIYSVEEYKLSDSGIMLLLTQKEKNIYFAK